MNGFFLQFYVRIFINILGTSKFWLKPPTKTSHSARQFISFPALLSSMPLDIYRRHNVSKRNCTEKPNTSTSRVSHALQNHQTEVSQTVTISTLRVLSPDFLFCGDNFLSSWAQGPKFHCAVYKCFSSHYQWRLQASVPFCFHLNLQTTPPVTERSSWLSKI
jgi:small-conductance mechanosensitive channel